MTALPPHPVTNDAPHPLANEAWSEAQAGDTAFGGNTLLTGNCLPLLAQVPQESVDLTVTSPPYDDLRRYDTPAPLDLSALGEALFRVTKDGGVCIVVIGDASHHFAKSLSSFRLALSWCDHAGWRLFETCLYHRHGVPGPWWRTRLRVDHEFIFVFFKGKRPKTFHKERLLIPTKHAGERVFYQPFTRASSSQRTDNSQRTDRSRRVPSAQRTPPAQIQAWQCRGTVWPYSPSSSERNQVKLEHPATMPDKLASDLIRGFSEPGDLVLDPLMGSGTSVVMAARLDRRYLGMDVSPCYVGIARRRLDAEALRMPAETMQNTSRKTSQRASRSPVAPKGGLDG
jgi:site-specific DNA-methyltransferase (adenine-specific)